MPRDLIDAEQLEELVRSAAYAGVARRYRKMYEAKLRDLTRPLDAVETAAARGFLAGVEACERVPEILKVEITSERRGSNRNRGGGGDRGAAGRRAGHRGAGDGV